MTDMSTDTETIATDREIVEIETKARANTVLHWPELIRLINRLRKAETEVERLREIIAQLLDNTHSHAVRRRAEAALKTETLK
jgi:hypothetical protein